MPGRQIARHARTPLVLSLLLPLACGSSSDSPDAGAAPPADAAAPAGDSAPGAVTYQSVQPLFMRKCTPCHVAGGTAADSHTLASSYMSARQAATAPACAGKLKGECTIILVKSGFMPLARGCSGNPAADATKTACLDAADHKLLEDWIAGGLKEN